MAVTDHLPEYLRNDFLDPLRPDNTCLYGLLDELYARLSRFNALFSVHVAAICSLQLRALHDLDVHALAKHTEIWFQTILLGR